MEKSDDDGVCWPSVARLAARCRVCPRQAINILHKLEADGAIAVQRGTGRGNPSHYLVKGETGCTLSHKGEIPPRKGEIQGRKGEIAIAHESPREPPQEPKKANHQDRSAQEGAKPPAELPQLSPYAIAQETRLAQCQVNQEGLASLLANLWPAEQRGSATP